MKQAKLSENVSLDIILSRVLQTGLLISLLITVCGGISLLWQRGGEEVNYEFFVGAPVTLRHLLTIVSEAVRFKALAFTQLGIMLMIITPILRVLSCVILFAAQRDRLYVVLSLFVLMILTTSLLWYR